MSTKSKLQWLVVALLVLAATVASATTVNLSGGSTVYNNGFNYYNTFYGVSPHGSTSSTGFTITLAGFSLGSIPKSATLTLGGILQSAFTTFSNGDYWSVSQSGLFTTIQVGSVSIPLNISNGSLTISNLAFLTVLKGGGPITISGYLTTALSPFYGNGNPQWHSCGASCSYYSYSSSVSVSTPQNLSAQLSLLVTPEPTSLLLMGTGALPLLLRLRRSRRV